MARAFWIIFVLLSLSVAVLLAVSNLGSRSAAPRIAAGPSVSEPFVEVLCRPPYDRETVRWVSRPFERSDLIEAIDSTPEAQKVGDVRKLYFDVLRRQAAPKDCAAIRGWIDGAVPLNRVREELADSPEGRRVDRIRQIFVEAFDRDPRGWDDVSLRRWVDSPFSYPEIKSRLAGQRPLVGIHYFTWYRPEGGHWRNDLTVVPDEAPRPVLGWYESGSPQVIATQVEQMAGLGVDFVIVHVIAQSPASWAKAQSVFDWLSGRNLKGALMLDGLYATDAAAKAMWVEKGKAEFAGRRNYFFFHGQPLIMLFSAQLNFTVPGVTLRNVYWNDRYDPGRNTFNGNLGLYPTDWPFWAATPQPLVNGAVPVIPGYVDTGLGRDRTMEHPRRNGETYHEQWRRALALRPELIMIYSWNEYFERTAIEPTEVWGDQYLRWTACYVEHAHRGTAGACN